MALQFVTASNQRIRIQSLSNLRNVTGATISVWTNITSVAATERYLCFYSTGTSTTSARLTVGCRTTASTFRCSARRLDADSVSTVDSTVSYQYGILTHIAGVARYDSGVLEIYVNGVLSNSLSVASWTGASSDTDSQTAAFGGRGDGSSGSAFNGIIGDTRVYNRALSSSEISNLYYARGKDNMINGLVNRFIMTELPEGQSGAVVINSTGGLPGLPINSPVYNSSLVSPRRKRK